MPPDSVAFNATVGVAGSYYAATANPFAPPPRLAESVEADLCVIGGGCTGLSAALHAAERGYSVVLLEGGRIGWGASGRNGGQMIPGLRKSAPELIRLYGEERARTLFDLSLEARDLIVDLVERERIDCDLKLTGHLHAACKPRDMDGLADEVSSLARVMRYPHTELLDRDATRAAIGSPRYQGALLDRKGGHLHPMNYTLGLAEAARRGGVRLFERSAATAVTPGAPNLVRTASGSVKTTYVLLACDAFLGDLDPLLAGKIMPVANYIVATEPLARPESVIAQDHAVSDTKFVVDYFRLSTDKRLIFGGGERYTPAEPADIAAFVRPHMLRVFPQLADTRIDYSWGGLVSVTMTRLPDIGRRGNVFYAHGYSGKGVALTSLAGKLVAEAIAGTAERFDIMAGIAPPSFPGGTRFRNPLYVLGMLWYALRDRL